MPLESFYMPFGYKPPLATLRRLERILGPLEAKWLFGAFCQVAALRGLSHMIAVLHSVPCLVNARAEEASNRIKVAHSLLDFA